jgi:ribosomal protein RSM22 (predicted rRNA methylase)
MSSGVANRATLAQVDVSAALLSAARGQRRRAAQNFGPGERTRYTEHVALPSALRDAVEQELSGLDRSRVTRASEQLTSNYKTTKFQSSLATAEARAAYLVARLPATYAACESVFAEIARLTGDFAPSSLLDLGAGPGTASWAAIRQWPSLRQFTMVENNRDLAEAGKRMAQSSEALSRASWNLEDLRSKPELPSSELVVLSYAIGELVEPSRLVRAAWNAATEMLVIIEPGTPRNFGEMTRLRSELIASGSNLLAPCPHQLDCPMAAKNDWCHFSVRLERTAEHRRMKGGALGYEDEKFSYLVFSKRPRSRAESRIVRHPMTHSGYIRLTLCASDGVQEKTVTRSQKSNFRAARRAKWGDEWRQLE